MKENYGKKTPYRGNKYQAKKGRKKNKEIWQRPGGKGRKDVCRPMRG